MECDVCGNFHSTDSTFLCPACARAALYPHRIRQARLLLEKEQVKTRVDSVLDSKNEAVPHQQQSRGDLNGDQAAKAKWSHEMNLAEIYKSQERIEEIVRKSQGLQSQIQQYKEEINQRKESASQKKQSVITASAHLARANPTILDLQKKSIRRKTQRYGTLTQDITSARTFLCKEAALLSGLQRHQRKTSEGVALEHFVLNGLPVVDLRDLNEVPPKQINASLANISRLLVQTCYYLGVRLPAEITLPKENYFHATIYSPYSSYLPRSNDYSLPGLTSSSSNSPSASRTIDPQSQASAQKLRPLFLHKKLSALMRENAQDHGYFIEGVSYLAWNIAWLCRLQGLAVANSDWEEICAMGRNLWLLLVNETTLAQRQQQDASRAKTPRKITQPSTPSETPEKKVSSTAPAPPPSLFGARSHGTTNMDVYYASSSAAATATPSATTSSSIPVDVSPRSWRFASPHRLIDKLKAHLVSDASGAEWEILSSGEFEGWVAGSSTAKVDDEPVLVASRARPIGSLSETKDPQQQQQRRSQPRDDKSFANGSAAKDPAQTSNASKNTAATASLDDETRTSVDADAAARPRGTSGWMKLKSRSGVPDAPATTIN